MAAVTSGYAYVGQAWKQTVTTGIDLTGQGSNIEVRYTKPDGSTGAKDATIEGAATAGVMSITFAVAELDQAGVWLFQGAIKDNDQPTETFALSVVGDFDKTTLPTPHEIREFLEGYCVTQKKLSDLWIARRRDQIVLWLERVSGQKVLAAGSITEHLSGTGSSILFLSRRPVTSIDSISYIVGPPDYQQGISLTGLELIGNQGVVKSRYDVEGTGEFAFARGSYNIKITYTCGNLITDEEVREGITALTAERMLAHLAGTTGGGPSISNAGYSRNYGPKGKWSQERKEMALYGLDKLSRYLSGVRS